MKKIIALLLALVMLLSLAACSGGEEDPNAGKYIGVSATVMGFSMPMSEIYSGEVWLELKTGGKGKIMLDGDSYGLKWALEGETITLTLEGVDSVGTLKNGDIVIDLMDMGCVMTFRKEKAEGEGVLAASYNDAGYWDLIRIDSASEETAVSEEDLTMLREMGAYMYLDLLPDGTGIFFVDEEMTVTWEDGRVNFTEDNMSINYTVENGEMILDMLEARLVFRKGEKPEPKVPEMEQAGFTDFVEVGVLYHFTTDANSANPVPTTGEAIITSYEVFDSAEGYPAKEGYEWHVVTMEATYFDDNARWYGIKLTTCSEDYYNTKLHDDSISEEDENGYETSLVIYNGKQMETYERYTGDWTGWHDSENGRRQNTLRAKYEYLMPKGYDGRVVGFVNSKNEWVKGSAYITDFDPADCMLFRLN